MGTILMLHEIDNTNWNRGRFEWIMINQINRVDSIIFKLMKPNLNRSKNLSDNFFGWNLKFIDPSVKECYVQEPKMS